MEELVKELLSMVKDIQKQNHEVMSKVLDAQSQHNEMMTAWFSMFKPTGTNTATGMDERVARANLGDESEYELLGFDPLAELLNEDS